MSTTRALIILSSISTIITPRTSLTSTLNIIVPFLVVSNLTSRIRCRAQNYKILTDKTFTIPISIRKPQNGSLDLSSHRVVKVSDVIRAIL